MEVKSSREDEKIPFFEEAIQHCISLLDHGNFEEDDDLGENQFEDLKKTTSMKRSDEEFMQESSEDCFYFYQVDDGGNFFLHPLCLKIIQEAFPESFT